MVEFYSRDNIQGSIPVRSSDNARKPLHRGQCGRNIVTERLSCLSIVQHGGVDATGEVGARRTPAFVPLSKRFASPKGKAPGSHPLATAPVLRNRTKELVLYLKHVVGGSSTWWPCVTRRQGCHLSFSELKDDRMHYC